MTNFHELQMSAITGEGAVNLTDVIHDTRQYANNRAEQSFEATRVRERGMRGSAFRRFKSVGQAQRFLGTHAAVS